MPQPKDTGGGMKYGPKKDRRLTKKFDAKVSNGGVLNQRQLTKMLSIIKRSKAQGTYNKKDAKLTKTFIDHFQSVPDNVNNNLLKDADQATASKYWNTASKIGKQANNYSKPGSGYSASDPIGQVGAKKPRASAPRPPVGGSGNGAVKNTPRPSGGGGSKKGSKGGKGGGGGGGAGLGSTSSDNMSYYGFGAPPKTSRNEAKATVQEEINAQVRALMHQVDNQKNASQYDMEKIRALYDRTNGDLNYVFGEANDYIGAQNGKIDQNYANTRQGMQQGFTNYQQAAQQQVAGRRGDASGELQRLGIQQTGLGQFDADAANNAGVAGVNQQNVMNNLGTMQAGSDEIGALLGSMSQASLASAKGRATNAKQTQIGDARQEYLQYYNDQLNRINDVKAQKGSMVNELYTAMQSNNFQQWMDMQQAQFNNQLATNQFNQDTSQMNSDNLWKKAALAQQAAEAKWKKKKWKANQESNTLAGQMADDGGISFLPGI